MCTSAHANPTATILKAACTDLLLEPPPESSNPTANRLATAAPSIVASVIPRPGFSAVACLAVAAASIGQIENHVHATNRAAAAIQPISTPYRHVLGSDTPTPTTTPRSSDTINRVRADPP